MSVQTGFETGQAIRQWAARPYPLHRVLQFAKRKPLGAVGGLILSGMVFVAICAALIAPYDPLLQDVPNRLRPPSPQFWFGTDNFGRDSFSRIIYGSRVSLYVGLTSVVMGTGIGVALGVASGYLGGKVDLGLQRIVDALMGFPALVLALVLVVSLGPSLNTVSIAIAVGFVPRMVRLSRASALAIKQETYVTAAQAMGCSTFRIITRHVLPNSMAPVFVLATGYLGTAIVSEASLSFLGLGVPPPHPTWGGMLQFGAQGYLESAPWLTIFPGFALTGATFGFALLGDALRDVLDPRLRGR
ncbi:MAG: ABC transporter permease [Dehalococcoidia bacterium]|nr:ABC transporter permease [Dehalococcoidia bacterium]